jgi:predicted N-acetyltransferase YhbS
MDIILRQETPFDYVEVSEAIMDTYAAVPYSNHKEQDMVARLRKLDSFIPQLSILAYDKIGKIAGHILLTKIEIKNEGVVHGALALAPLSIRPAYQNKGIGRQLVLESHRVAKSLGFKFIVVLGIPKYYLKFGYQFASKFNMKFPIKISETTIFVIALKGEDYSLISGGIVVYPKEFFGECY